MKHDVKSYLSSVLLVLFVASMVQIPIVHSMELAVQDKALAFLANVAGFDLSKYSAKLEGVSASYDSTFGPLVKEESVSYTLDADGSQVRAAFVFENGLLWYSDLSYVKGSAIYKQSPSTSVLDQVKSLVQNYQIYVGQNYEEDTSYVQSMRNIIDGISELKAQEKTVDNLKLQVSITPIDNIVSTVVKWVYTENNVDVPRKSMAMYFRNGTFWFMSDTWNLLTIGSRSLISQEEALKMAWAKAQNYTLNFVSDNGSTLEIKPDLSNVTTK